MTQAPSSSTERDRYLKGHSVQLVPFSDDADYLQLWEWMMSDESAYGSGSPEIRPVHEIRQLAGQSNYLMIRTLGGRNTGLVEWKRKGYSGHFTLGVLVGDKALWGRGYGVEAVMLLLELLFHAYNAHRIQITVGSYNRRMIEIFTQGPVQIEGVLRDYFFVDGEYHDALIGSILRHEYYQLDKLSQWAPRNIIPSEEKREARQILRRYLAEHPLATPDLSELELPPPDEQAQGTGVQVGPHGSRS